MTNEIQNEPENTYPSYMDIIKIDGSWAQIFSLGGEGELVKFLGDRRCESLDLRDYKLTRHIDHSVSPLMELEGNLFSEIELSNIRWGPEEKNYPYLKLITNVFGEYVSRTE